MREFGPSVSAVGHPECGDSIAIRARTELGAVASGPGTRDMQLARDELNEINRGKLLQRVSDHVTEFNDSQKARERRGTRNLFGRYGRGKRSASRKRKDSPNRAPKRGGYNRRIQRLQVKKRSVAGTTELRCVAGT